jgi:hypothetical protein
MQVGFGMHAATSITPSDSGQGAPMADNQPPETRNPEDIARNRDVETESKTPPEPVEDVEEEVEDDDRFQATDN